MAVGGDYSSPVYVNGYQCWNCAAVAEAKKDVNPADPQAGPGGANAKTGSTGSPAQSPAVIFGGVLANSAAAGSSAANAASTSVQSASGASVWGQTSLPYAAGGPGAQLNISV